jgi:hypothetical protein
VKIQNIVTTSESTYYAKLDLLERSASTSPNIVYEDSFLVKSDAAAGYLAPMPSSNRSRNGRPSIPPSRP